MAEIDIKTIAMLRNTASRIEKSPHYQWGHMGSCNCGFLAQEITHLNKEQIHSRAMEGVGDWREQLEDYCPTSGMRMDDIITAIVNAGFSTDDLKHLERLSDPLILRSFPLADRNLRHNLGADVTKYLRRWADLLESKLLEEIEINPSLGSSLHDEAEDCISSNPLVHCFD
jgi:hypothetical protein